MKKRIRLKWVVLSIVLILVLWLAITLVTTLPFYDAFQKEVDSYAELQEALEDYPEICLPDPFTLELEGEFFYLELDDRNLFADTIGYSFGGVLLENGLQLNYGFTCNQWERNLSNADLEYCGIPLLYDSFVSSETSSTGTSIIFALGGQYYSFGTYYNYNTMSKEEIDAVNSTIRYTLLEIAQNTIDVYINNQ